MTDSQIMEIATREMRNCKENCFGDAVLAPFRAVVEAAEQAQALRIHELERENAQLRRVRDVAAALLFVASPSAHRIDIENEINALRDALQGKDGE